jgi:pimeloyl-ACP methyl ester carboxylesterase
MMDRLEFDGVEVTYEIRGHGEPVVLVHASAFVPWYAPLVEQLPQFSVLSYTRRLERGGAGIDSFTVATDAAICVRLMDHVAWQAAHVAGHSYGALVALQLARDAPERVGSLAVLEPAVRAISSSTREKVVAALQPVVASYRSGDKQAAVDLFLQSVCGAGYRDALERAVPGAFATAVEEADLFFQMEMPAVAAWRFGPGDAQRITQPVLNVLGTQSPPRFVEGAELVQAWFPAAERLSLEGAGHLLMIENPNGLAQGLADFFSRHPIGDAERSSSPNR